MFGAEGDGTARLGGYNLPADQALQADAQISARARGYRQAGLGGSMELLRAQAFLDILAGLDRRAGTSPAPHDGQPGPGGDADEETARPVTMARLTAASPATTGPARPVTTAGPVTASPVTVTAAADPAAAVPVTATAVVRAGRVPGTGSPRTWT